MRVIQSGSDQVLVAYAFEKGLLYFTAGAPGNDWGEVALGPEAVDQLIAHLIEVRGAERVQELLSSGP